VIGLNKKGDISLNYIIIAIIALVVLVIAVLFFSGAAQKIVDQLRGVSSGVPEQIKASWKSQCELACISCEKSSYDNLQFSYTEGDVTDIWSCNGNTGINLGVGPYETVCGPRCNAPATVAKKTALDCRVIYCNSPITTVSAYNILKSKFEADVACNDNVFSAVCGDAPTL